MYEDHKIGLVLPAYNEERLIVRTLQAVPDYVDRVYVVDDASLDETAQVVTNIGKQDPRVLLLQHKKNVGPGGAIITGYQQSSQDACDIVVVAGADFQMPFEQMTDLLDPLIRGEADYTKGNRFMAGGNAFRDMPRIRLFANTLISLMTKVASGYFKIFDVVDGYTAITKQAIDVIQWDRVWKAYGYPMNFLVHLNVYRLRVKDIPRRAIYLEGERQSQIKGVRYALKVAPMLVKAFFWRIWEKYLFSNFHPLVFLYFISFLFLPIGFALGAYLVWVKLHGVPPTGATAVACALFLNVGIQSLFFAMLFDMMEDR